MICALTRREMLASIGTLAGGAIVSASLPAIASAEPASRVLDAPRSRNKSGKHDQPLPRAGDFGSSCLAGFYDPVPDDQKHTDGYFGLALDAAWPYGGVETESGKRFLMMRKITYGTTNYHFLQVSGPESYSIDKRSFQNLLFGGTVKRQFKGGYDTYDGKLVPNAGLPNFQLKIGHEDFTWVEDRVLSLTGKRVLPGWHVYVPWRSDEGRGSQGGCYYTSACWLTEGTIFGERCKGFFFLDHDYLPQGLDWNADEDLVWTKLQQTWGVFATEWDDGTVEWGHFCRGWGDFQFGSVADSREGMMFNSRDVAAKFDFSPDGWTRRIDFTFDGRERWEYVTAPNGRFVDASRLFSINFNTDWRGHAGRMQRVGEKRKSLRDFAWQEVFPARCGWTR